MNVFGENLRNIRIEKGWSQEELAAILGTTKQVISRYETGQRIPKVSVVADFAEKLQLSIGDLTSTHKDGFFYFLCPEDDTEVSESNENTSALYRPDPDEEELISLYHELNSTGRNTLLGTARGLYANPAMKQDGASNEKKMV